MRCTVFSVFVLLLLHYVFSQNISFFSLRPDEGICEYHFIDVGQGDAILIRTKHATVLVDTGPNSAEKALDAYLKKENIRSIDLFVLTHPDEDHIGNADFILKNYSVKKLIMPCMFSDSLSYSLLMSAADLIPITPEYAYTGNSYIYDGLELFVLSPITVNVQDTNEASLVIRASYGNTVCLLMGDAGTDTEEFIISVFGNEMMECNILKVGHHGSSSSTGNSLLTAAHPDFAVISCGKNNSFGHPASGVLQHLKDSGAEICRTDLSGNIVFTSDGTEIKKEP